MEIKTSIKKEVHSLGGVDGVEILVKNISLNLNSHNDEQEILLILKTIVTALNESPQNFIDEDKSFLRVLYDNFKPNNSPGFDSVLKELEDE